MKKKLILFFSVLLIVIIIPVLIYQFLYVDNSKVSNGKYYIQNSQDYPDAYIEVKDGRAKFVNIDLNAIYQKNVVSRYIETMEAQKEQKLNDKQKTEATENIDLNKKFCNDFFEIEYDIASSHRSKYEYNYIFSMITDFTGLQCTYDYHEKSITVENEPKTLIFKK